MRRLEQGLGILLTLIILLDVFLTVLYARIGTSISPAFVSRCARQVQHFSGELHVGNVGEILTAVAVMPGPDGEVLLAQLACEQ